MRVYLARNRMNGKGYVGLTTKPVLARWRLHIQQRNSSMAISHAIRKHGEDVFDLFLLEECDDVKALKIAERKWIKRLDTFHGPGYNLTEGGDGLLGYRHTEDAKRRISEAHRGEKNHNYGKAWRTGPLTEQAKRKLSEGRRGKDNPMWGKKKSPETLAKLSTSQKKRVRKSVCVVQMDKDGTPIATHFSPQLAAEVVAGRSDRILSCCKGERTTHCGYKWKYANHIMWKHPSGVFSPRKG